jgi:hypothetical protein
MIGGNFQFWNEARKIAAGIAKLPDEKAPADGKPGLSRTWRNVGTQFAHAAHSGRMLSGSQLTTLL